MNILRRIAGVIRAAAAGAVLAASGPASAQEVVLKVHHFLPPTAPAQVLFIGPWTEKVSRESGGRLKFQIFPSMQLGGSPPQLYDQAKDGVADLVWTLLGYTAGRFPASEVFELPFMNKTAESASRALWEYAQVNNLFAGEFKDVKPIVLHVHDRGLVHTVGKQVKTLDDFKGMKLRAPTRLTNRMLAAFGATPVGMPVPQVPDALSKGVIDGAVIPWEIVPALKLHEMVKFHTETDPNGRALYTATFMFAMNKAKYESLAPELKKAIDANSGVETSAWVGKAWDDSALPARKLAEGRGNTFYTVPASELANWEKASQKVVDDWIKETDAKGLNGQALLKNARELIAKYERR